ncbi:hypothetical protein BDY24DRAFT_377956 [Mrakia frigida]|uniref:transcription factor TFIIIC subunit TFC4 n=1 Tax=Mrakia frigida TaxID=29902 RepID=UPI003FCBFBF8
MSTRRKMARMEDDDSSEHEEAEVDDDDPSQWGFGQDQQDDEDDEDVDEWARNSDPDSGSEYFGSDDERRPKRGEAQGPRLGEAGPSRPRGAPDPQDAEGGEEGMDDLESGQFNRLVKSIRSGTNLSGSEVLTQNWDQSIEEAEAEDALGMNGPVPGAARRSRRRGTGTGRRREPELDPAIQQLLGQGNMYYVQEDYVKAIETYQEVITQEPAVHVAWTTLSTCHSELGNVEKALQCEMMAAHLRPSNEVWKELGAKSRAAGAMDQAIYCYKKAVACDHDDIDAIWDHAYLLRETGQHAKAIEGFQTILKQTPNDLAIILEMSNSFVEAHLLPLGQRLILAALHKQQRLYPDPVSSPPPAPIILFPISLLVVLFDILIATEQWGKAIMECKKAVRWLGGRLKETRWEKVGDDREFDEEGVKRGAGTSGGEGREAEGYELDVNLRHRLGLARLNLGDVDEARIHFDIIKRLDPTVYQVLWGEIGEAYLAKSMFDDALEFFEPLSEITSLPKHVEGRGDCLRANEDFEGARESYLFVIASFENENDPASLKVRMKTAYVYEQLGQRQEALDLVNEVLEIRRLLPVTRGRKRRVTEHTLNVDATGSILNRGPRVGSEKQARLNRDQIEANNIRKVELGFARLDVLDGVMDGGEDHGDWEEDGGTVMEWLEIAGPLIEQFRETKTLFPQDRNKPFTGIKSNRGRKKGWNASSKKTAEEKEQEEAEEVEAEAEAEAEGFSERLQRDMEGDAIAVEDTQPEATSLRGVPVERWFEMAIKYCCLLAKYDDPEHAYEVSDHLLYANVFRQVERQQALRLTGLACLMATNDTQRIAELARRIVHIKQFSNLALHILVSSVGSGLKAAEALVNVNLQKSLARDIRVWESAAAGDQDVIFHPISGRWAAPQKRKGGQSKGKKKAPPPVKGKGKTRKVQIDDDDDDDEEDYDDENEGGGAGGGGAGGGGVGGGEGRFGEKPVVPTKTSPVLTAYFGAIMCLGRSFQSGIYYLLRAHDMNPVDPLVCLLLAIAYVGRAFQRQCDNRNYCVVTGMTFLDRYRKLHPEGEDADEVEYNFGTMFHRMGLYYLAINHFKRVLARAEKTGNAWKDDPKSLARETAYNLCLIYGTCGSPHAARDVGRKWLSI